MSDKQNSPGHRITAVWLFLAIDADGDEGLPGFTRPDGAWVPLVCSDERRVELLRPMAQAIATASGSRIELVKFGGARELIEVIEP